jgi:hypothetical protein
VRRVAPLGRAADEEEKARYTREAIERVVESHDTILLQGGGKPEASSALYARRLPSPRQNAQPCGAAPGCPASGDARRVLRHLTARHARR